MRNKITSPKSLIHSFIRVTREQAKAMVLKVELLELALEPAARESDRWKTYKAEALEQASFMVTAADDLEAHYGVAPADA